MKTIFLSILLAFSAATKAQVIKVSLQASGLTCSMCSNAINRALKTLDFINRVDADIKTYTFEIYFKPTSSVDFDLIKRKVENAGFSVSRFVVTMLIDTVHVLNDHPVTVAGQTFLFTGIKERSLSGVQEIKILDKGFISAREFKYNAFPVSAAGSYNASIL